jgi:hypothetical protein
MVSPRLLRASSLGLVTAAIIVGARQSVQTQTPEWRTRFSRAALQIPFDSERAPVPEPGLPPNAYPDSAPRMTIALPKTRDTGQVARIESRITSGGAYRRLGLAPGVNYVWLDVVKDTIRQWVIPANTKYPVRWVAFTAHKHSGPQPWPRLVVFDTTRSLGAKNDSGAALANTRMKTLAISRCTPYCPTYPWCSGRDSTRTDNFFPTTAAMIRYFERNGVVWKAK